MATMALRQQRESRPELFDVNEAFTRSLYESRVAHGEPARGLRRRLWSARRLMREDPARARKISLALGGLALSLGGIYALARINQRGGRKWLRRRM